MEQGLSENLSIVLQCEDEKLETSCVSDSDNDMYTLDSMKLSPNLEEDYVVKSCSGKNFQNMKCKLARKFPIAANCLTSESDQCSTPKKTLFDENFVEMKSPAVGKFLVEAVESPTIAIDRMKIFGCENSSSHQAMSPMSFSPKDLLTKKIIKQNAETTPMKKQAMKRNSLVPKKISLDEINLRKNKLERDNPQVNKFKKYHSKVETVKKCLDEEDENANLIADFSAPYILPIIEGGKHGDLKAISHDTLSDVLLGKYDACMDSFTIVDCRYPYEYDGGHIIGAKNIYTKDSIFNEFISTNSNLSSADRKKNILIFHCEFSSERGPKMCRFLRNKDRELNQENYPRLFYPEIYLLEYGYKEFFSNHKVLCDPSSYKPMLHEDNADDLIKYKAESKMYFDRFEKRSNSRALSRLNSRKSIFGKMNVSIPDDKVTLKLPAE